MQNKNWSDISVIQYQELSQLKITDFEDEDDYIIQLMSIIHDTDSDTIENLDYLEYKKLVETIGFISTNPTREPKSVISISDTKLHLIDYNHMTIGEFIDLNSYFDNNLCDNLTKVLAILYRLKTPSTTFEESKLEPYGTWVDHRAPLFNDVCVNDIFGVINQYLEFRKMIFEQYVGLFDEPQDPNQDADIETELKKMSIRERSEYKKALEKEQNLNKWGWGLFLFRLAGKDPLKLEAATNIPLITGLNIMAMCKAAGIDL